MIATSICVVKMKAGFVLQKCQQTAAIHME